MLPQRYGLQRLAACGGKTVWIFKRARLEECRAAFGSSRIRAALFALEKFYRLEDAAPPKRIILNDIKFLKISKIAIAGSTGFKVEHL
jgi:hypothetical protein